ncbi:hypothetical protein DsansV1_C25g0188861 [Dioscorea sansibarensis]
MRNMITSGNLAVMCASQCKPATCVRSGGFFPCSGIQTHVVDYQSSSGHFLCERI